MKREKSKWLVALVLCITCLALCVSLITAPTLANPDVPGDPDYTGSETLSESESESLSETASETGTETETASESESESVTASESATESESASVTDSSSASESTSETASESETASTSESESSSETASIITIPTVDEIPTQAKTLYKAVAGQIGVFEILSASGESLDPAQYVYSQGNDPEIGTNVAAYPRGEKFYVAFPAYSNIYQAVTADGKLNLGDAIWAGPDKIFGTADDKEAKFEGGVFWFLPTGSLDGIWQAIENLVGQNTENSVPVSSTGTVTTTLTSTGGSTSSTSPFFSGGSASLVPNTGSGVNTGILVCIAILVMGSAYCAYRLFRKDESASAYTVA
ncbi:MAG: hypothetical protein LBS96_06440 [Oscillospiraceae bacterium]|jgi:hypothetical protein|nr:hypothetical protein [Oscillospiraceae bacterium]